MAMKCAGEIMLPLDAFPCIPYWFSLRQALAELESVAAPDRAAPNAPWIIPIFNAQNQFLGLVQRQDILRGLQPKTSEKIRDFFPGSSAAPADPDLSRLSFSPQKAIQDLKEKIERQIIEFMAPVQITIDYEDPALLAIHLMIDRGLTFVPVVKAGQIAGILYIEDALNEVVATVV